MYLPAYYDYVKYVWWCTPHVCTYCTSTYGCRPLKKQTTIQFKKKEQLVMKQPRAATYIPGNNNNTYIVCTVQVSVLVYLVYIWGVYKCIMLMHTARLYVRTVLYQLSVVGHARTLPLKNEPWFKNIEQLVMKEPPCNLNVSGGAMYKKLRLYTVRQALYFRRKKESTKITHQTDVP